MPCFHNKYVSIYHFTKNSIEFDSLTFFFSRTEVVGAKVSFRRVEVSFARGRSVLSRGSEVS